MPAVLVHDPSRNVTVTALIPAYAATVITTVTPQGQALEMDMAHGSAALAGVATATCASCHSGAGTGTYYPGVLHASLAALALPQPTTCRAATPPRRRSGSSVRPRPAPPAPRPRAR